MKRWIFLITAILILFTGCSKTPEMPEPLEEQFDNTGKKTVVYRGDQNFTLSFTEDGEQKIENGTYWYYELADAYEQDWSEPFYTYDLKKQNLDGVTDYAKLETGSCFATNGNWPLFLNPVHTEYSASNQNMVDHNLTKMAEQQLSANQLESTVMVTDVWSCDMDGDGGEETLFMARNANEEDAYFCFLGYTDGENCQGLYSSVSTGEKQKEKEVVPLVCDLNGDGKWSLLLYKRGTYESFTSYDFTGGNFVICYEIIF